MVAGYEFFDYYESAQQIGGDYYDYVLLPGNRLAIILADVSGKGISAALLMAKISSEARYSLVSEPTPAAAMTRLNASFGHGRWEDRFVTMVMAVLDLATGEMTLANAGHMPPIMRRANGQVLAIGDEAGGVPLGVDEGACYEQAVFTLTPGDLVTAFTDGISEAMNEANSLYTIERIERVVDNPVTGANDLGGRILGDVKKFVGTRTQSDDMCLVCFGRGK
jgi:serine phosphatase RsbU (regulator of sigma subunit)